MENSLEFPGLPKIVSLDVIFKLKFRLTNSNKNNLVYLQKGVKCQMFLGTTREKAVVSKTGYSVLFTKNHRLRNWMELYTVL